MVLLIVSFIAGVLTALAPCVLPLLPVIVGGSLAGGSRRRSLVITASLAISIIVFTLVLKASTAFIGVPENVWRNLSGGVIIFFGIFLLFPNLWAAIPGVNALSRGSNKLLAVGYQQGSFWGDVVMGAALGPVFASCSPTYFIILATVLPAQPILGFVYLGAYAVGLSLMLLLIAILGDRIVQKLGVTIEPEGLFRRGIGVLFILVGVLVATGTMRNLETWLVERGLNLSVLEYQLLPGQDMPNANVAPNDAAQMLTPDAKALVYSKAPELVSPDGYLNTPRLPSGQAGPITIGEFKGKKVVLIDIWTYSCINCQRTLPYLKMWHEKYKDQGLEIIGVHTPEFAFEKVQANVERAAKEFGLEYPIVLDNEYRTWNAFGNHFWPRKYLVDIDGYIVYDHAGEGEYDVTEQAIEKALAERAERLGSRLPADSSITPPSGTVAVDFYKVGSPEVYFGSARNEFLGNGKANFSGPQDLSLPEKFAANTLYLGGTWDIQGEFAESKGGGQVRFIYSAKNVYFVASAAQGVRIRVTRDGGKSLGKERGADVGEDGWATISEDRLYELVKGTEYGAHLLEISIEGEGLQAYTFTFG